MSTQTNQRIVVKLGTSLLTGGSGQLDLIAMASLVKQIAGLLALGSEVLIVSSGAIAAGEQQLNLKSGQVEVSMRQVLAAVGQSHLMQTYQSLFSVHSIPVAQALLTRRDLTDRVGYLNVRNTLLSLLELGVVPIVNENDVVAVEEIGEVFGDNDNLSSMVANILDADKLLILSDISGLYTTDPHSDPDARLIPIVTRVDSNIEGMAGTTWSSTGRGGMATKLQAAKFAMASGVTTVIADGGHANIVSRLANGEAIGTLFPPTTSRLESRKRWLLSKLTNKGTIQVDPGASGALTQENRSLLPVGVQSVDGLFSRGDSVPILSPDKSRIACGIVNYSSKDLSVIKGCQSGEIENLLGYDYGHEVIHRNNLVIL